MYNLALPGNSLYKFAMTGKFEAPNEYWKHDRFPLHEYELIIVTEGTLYLSYNGNDYSAGPGEYILLPPSDSERIGYKEAYSAFYWLHFSTDSLTDTEPLLLPDTGRVPKPEKLIVLMKQLQDMKKNGYPEVALNACATTILMELYGELTLFPKNTTSVSLQKQIYNDIIDYIEDNIYDNLKVSDIARHFGYNEKYLSHRFTEIAGVPLKQYIMKAKIEKANFLLTDTNESVKDISKRLGFSDSHNFCRTYKSLTGLTPGQYRDAYSKRLLFHY